MTVKLTTPNILEEPEFLQKFPFILEHDSPLSGKREYYFAYKKGNRNSIESIEVVNLEIGEMTWFKVENLGVRPYRISRDKIVLENLNVKLS